MPSERSAWQWHVPPLPLAAAWLVLALGSPACALAQPVPEHDMKAAYIFNFAIFTQWPQTLPAAAGTPLFVCASAASPLFAALGQLKDKPINGRPLALRPAVGALQGCHVLVLERADRERWPQWKRDLAGSAVLTVTDDHVIGKDGPMISMNLDAKRLVFDIDMTALRAARLNLSSKLLRLARSVQ